MASPISDQGLFAPVRFTAEQSVRFLSSKNRAEKELPFVNSLPTASFLSRAAAFWTFLVREISPVMGFFPGGSDGSGPRIGQSGSMECASF